MTPSWDPPSLVLVALGAAALLGWLVLSPPTRRNRISAVLQIAAALLLRLLVVHAWPSHLEREAEADGGGPEPGR